MLSAESLPVAEQEEVVQEEEAVEQELEETLVESCSNKLSDVYTLVAKGCFPLSMSPLRRKNLRRYAQKFIIDGEKKTNSCSFISWLSIKFKCADDKWL